MNATKADYRGLVARYLESGELSLDDVDHVMLALGGGLGNTVLPTDHATLAAVLDCFHAAREIEPDDGAHPWNQAVKLKEIGRHVEAAALFLRAAELFAIDAREGTGATGDEADWAQSALWHATNSMLAARRPLAAAIVARRIDDSEHRSDAEDSIRKWLDS